MQRQIKSLQQYAQLKGEERRYLLKSLSDEQYEDVMKVLGNMPYIDFQVRCEGNTYNNFMVVFINNFVFQLWMMRILLKLQQVPLLQ